MTTERQPDLPGAAAGARLYRAEFPGPIKDTKLTPHITETAKAPWYIYLGLTVACALSYWFAGMLLVLFTPTFWRS